ncbi:Bug family tripartite tricarboxylate transporter substrate binding protein [Variovorax terrae]|uniref:Tripartite tricarboxylate transporter substrate binding protein n=1 Tax=Variovorax terrae TaxID=2923278 RepID=A0A9X1VS67_9BURK|nr:tripartite tricarboxylate transporter substrate binding protein [Variovorax terrae]MCJ0762372.1 tripartite tricarboxylate transporter substrate binding protein [Variovorax terrae]
MKTSSALFLRLAVGALALASSCLAHAWPDRPVKLIVPAPAGGNMDVTARIYATSLSREIGQPVVVENKAGAGGSIGVQAMLNAPADGHTILFTSSNVLSEIPYVFKPPYDPMNDVRPVAALARYRFVLVVAPDYPANDMAGLAAQLKVSPDQGNFASPSPGTLSQLGGEMLNRRFGVNMQHVPFSGTPPALLAVMSRQVTMYLDSVVTSAPFVRGGKLKPLGVAGTSRFPGLPQVPTFAEQGYPEFTDFTGFQGIVVSPKMPAADVDKLYAVTRRIASRPQFTDQVSQLGFEPVMPTSPQEFAQQLQAHYTSFGALIRTMNLKP